MNTQEKSPTPIDLWLTDWKQQNYSWKALEERAEQISGTNTTDFWRRTAAGNLRTDAELQEAGYLIDCGERGMFHVAYIPPKWYDELALPNTQVELLNKAWQEQFLHLTGQQPVVFQGVFLTEMVAGRLNLIKDASFIRCCFVNDLSISLVYGDLIYKNSLFLGKASSSSFGNNADISKSLKFEKCDFFNGITFESGRFDVNLILDNCIFRSSFKISEAESLGSMRIDSCRFDGVFSISQTRVLRRFSVFCSEFCRDFELYYSRFCGEASFNESSLNGDINIVACRFEERARFGDVAWPKMGSNVAWGTETFFADDVAFLSNPPPPIQLFDGIRFEGAVSFSSGIDKDWLSAFEAELHAVRVGFAEHAAPTEMQQLESGCRTLRKLAAINGNVHLEHQWHRCELIARRSGTEVSAVERGLSYMYGFCADYGLSISRPFLILAGLCGFFACTYAANHSGIDLSGEIDWESLTEGLGYSLNRTLPIGVFEFSNSAWRTELLGSAGTWKSIAVRTVASLQTITSFILIYLGAMAARRKFKIS